MDLKNKDERYIHAVASIIRNEQEDEFLEGLALFYFQYHRDPAICPLSFFGHDLQWGFWKARRMLTRMINLGVYDIHTNTLRFETLPKPWKKCINELIARL